MDNWKKKKKESQYIKGFSTILCRIPPIRTLTTNWHRWNGPYNPAASTKQWLLYILILYFQRSHGPIKNFEDQHLPSWALAQEPKAKRGCLLCRVIWCYLGHIIGVSKFHLYKLYTAKMFNPLALFTGKIWLNF